MYLSSASSRLLLYDTYSWELKKSYGCYDGLMRDVSWSDDGKYILQVNSKGMIEILSPADHEIRSLQHIPLKDTWAASFHRDGHHNIAIGTKSGNVVIWDTKNKSITKKFPAPSQHSSVNHLSYNSRNSSLAATMQNGETIIYGLVSNIPVNTVKLHCSKSISAMKFHHDLRSLLGLATYEGHVFLRDITTNKDKAFFENVHAAPVSDFAYSLINKDVVLSSGYDKVLHIYDVRLQNVVSSVCTTHILTSLTVNINNEVAIGTKNGSILVYDLRDYSTPIKILKGHNEEVSKVAFQPVRRKSLLSTEVSLKEDRDIELTHTPQKTQSPIKRRNSDMFYITDTPPTSSNIDICSSDNKAGDSFLAMLGLDKTETDLNDFDEKTSESENNCNKLEARSLCINIENNLTKASTPITDRIINSPHFASPANPNGDENIVSNISIPKQMDGGKPIFDTNTLEELKDFIKLTVSDLADDNRNYFLHTMMVLTKQKIFLEKQLTAVNEQLVELTHNQTVLLEANRSLSLEMDQLKRLVNNNLNKM